MINNFVTYFGLLITYREFIYLQFPFYRLLDFKIKFF